MGGGEGGGKVIIKLLRRYFGCATLARRAYALEIWYAHIPIVQTPYVMTPFSDALAAIFSFVLLWHEGLKNNIISCLTRINWFDQFQVTNYRNLLQIPLNFG